MTFKLLFINLFLFSFLRVRIQPLNDAQVNQGQMIQMMPNVVVPQLSNSMPPADHHPQPWMKSAG